MTTPSSKNRSGEPIDKDAELEEGYRQLREVREFLRQNPDYRDHITNTLEQDGLWLAEFDALNWARQN